MSFGYFNESFIVLRHLPIPCQLCQGYFDCYPKRRSYNYQDGTPGTYWKPENDPTDKGLSIINDEPVCIVKRS